MLKTLPPLFRLETILPACLGGELILTSNRRLCTKALEAWGRYQQSHQRNAWQRPRLFTLDDWFERCWQRLQAGGHSESFHPVAGSQQVRVLWEKLLADCGFMQPQLLARQTADAFTTLQRWQLPLSCLDAFIDPAKNNGDNAGIDVYRQWCVQFRQALQRHSLITREDSIAIIGRAFEDNCLAREASIHLLGFHDIAPLIDSQLDRMSPQLIHVNTGDQKPQSLERRHFPDHDAEINAAARWAKTLLEQQPHSRIAIIAPDLTTDRERIERALTEQFEGHSLLAETPRYTLPFNISAGIPLAQTPLITDTLLLLQLTRGEWSTEDLCHLLFSPFWGKFSEELEIRCRVAERLQQRECLLLSLTNLYYYLANHTRTESGKGVGDQPSTLFQSLLNARSLLRQYQGMLTPSRWANCFLELLEVLNWPGDRQPDSHEYQQIRQWYSLLEDFAALDPVIGKIDAASAIQQLEHMAGQHVFQPEVADSPIQVLGMLEASGLYFDHCRVIGLDQQSWPAAPRPGRLLPLSLQSRHNMPHATHLRELAFARSLTAQFRHCARHISFSVADYDNDTERALLPSDLIADIPRGEVETFSPLSAFTGYQQRLLRSQNFQQIPTHQGPAIEAADINAAGEVEGGASVIRDQAANPFDAFAIHRLQARRPNPPVAGFSAMEQGNILHQSMAAIWQQLKNRDNLLATDQTILKQLVRDSVSDSIRAVQKRKRQIGQVLCNLETGRQGHLIEQWLEYEKDRPPFSVVAIEEDCPLILNDTRLRLRIDRVDELEDGSWLIIDYKTGSVSINGWLGERPADPQLPLYLLACEAAHEKPVAGIAFASININQQSLTGLEAGGHPIPGLQSIADYNSKGRHKVDLPQSWPEARELWHRRLQALLDAWLSGDCRVDYRDTTGVNRARNLLPLNRYHDSRRLQFFSPDR